MLFKAGEQGNDPYSRNEPRLAYCMSWTSLSSTQESCIPLFITQPVHPWWPVTGEFPHPAESPATHSFTRLCSSAWSSLTWRFRNKSHFLMPSVHLIFSPLPAFLYYRNKWGSVWENEASQMIPAFTALKLPRCTFLPLPCALANRACTGMRSSSAPTAEGWSKILILRPECWLTEHRKVQKSFWNSTHAVRSPCFVS